MDRGEKTTMTNNNDNGFFKKKGTERKRLFLIIGAAVLLLTFIGIYSRREAIFSKTQNSNGSQPAAVKVQTVKADKVVRESIIQNTSIDAVDRVKILPRVTGRLEKLHVLRGDTVKKGQTIATLEHDQQDALIGSVRAQEASAKADSERARAEMMNAKTGKWFDQHPQRSASNNSAVISRRCSAVPNPWIFSGSSKAERMFFIGFSAA